ncbi:MAG: hypothetical protein KAS66_00290 [Candidatus Omnitrophica bacterium]|nr:hypothetical protein [Candidatus Omnitrophota bacterium]
MARKDFTDKAGHIALYQDSITATPSAPTAVDVSEGLMGGFLITGKAGITLDATNRIDFKAYKGTTAALAEAAGSPVVSADIGGGAVITGGIIASAQLAATLLAGYFIPYVGDPSYVTVIPNMEGTHGTASDLNITYIVLDKENK